MVKYDSNFLLGKETSGVAGIQRWAATKECLVRYLRQVPVPVFCGICTTFEASMAGIYGQAAPG